jgi:hypothetical protein
MIVIRKNIEAVTMWTDKSRMGSMRVGCKAE